MKEELRQFHEFGSVTERSFTAVPELKLEIETFTNEFWTSAQRACHSLHEISYRACFKPQLPAFFIRRLTRPGDVVYDPFMGRGTTPLEAALSGRVPAGCDVNPLSAFLLAPRLAPPSPRELEERLRALDLTWNGALPEELFVFYHEETLRELCALREYFRSHPLDRTDAWLRMVALNRLTGHSAGFFSVYTLPPNQAVSVESQRKINEKRRQTPPRRDVKAILLKKSRALLKDCTAADLKRLGKLSRAWILTGSSDRTPQIPGNAVSLVVTSPPFLPRAGNFFVRFCSSIFIATSVFCRRRTAFHSGEIGLESNFQGKISDFSRFSMFSAAAGRHSVLLKLNTSDYSGFPGGSQDLREILFGR